ncbi:CHU large protein [Seminavis robusta]|uniref:CHU large protein n=1 Tax=Seminavis robusta TaxID=568900 RepID=A0A9N8HHR8_9STRA|nr:CHU large protein [Seminavis robusta]|eukprot:Sro726_g193490.1 CHU large protein (1337) ;mRNA; r:31084-35263
MRIFITPSHDEATISQQESVEVADDDVVLPLHAQDELRPYGVDHRSSSSASLNEESSMTETTTTATSGKKINVQLIHKESSDDDDEIETGDSVMEDEETSSDTNSTHNRGPHEMPSSHHSLPSPEEMGMSRGKSRLMRPPMAVVDENEREVEVEYKGGVLYPNKRRRLYVIGGSCLLLMILAIIIGAVVGTQKNKNDHDPSTTTEGNKVIIDPDNPNRFPPTPAPIPNNNNNNDDDISSGGSSDNANDDGFPPAFKPGSDPDLTDYCPQSLELRGVVISDFNQSVVLYGETDNATLIGINNNPNATTEAKHALPICGESEQLGYGRGIWYVVKGPGAVVRASTCQGLGLLWGDTGGNTAPVLDTQLTVFTSQTPTCADGLTCVTHNDDASCAPQSLVSWYAEKDRIYYIYVSGKPITAGTLEAAAAAAVIEEALEEDTPALVNRGADEPLIYPTGSFMLTLSLAPTGTCDAAIDYKGEAETISLEILDPEQQKGVIRSSPLIVGSLLGAAFGLDPCVPGEWLGRGGEIWYKVMGTGRWLMASTCSSSSVNEFSARLALYQGNCDQLDCGVAKASEVAPSVDRDCGFGYSLNWWSQRGVEYYIMVYKTNFLPGIQFGLTVEDLDPPVNDNCTGAARLYPDGYVTFGSTLRATYTEDQLAPTCMNNDVGVNTDVMHTHPGVWYRVVGTGTRLTASLCHDKTKYDTKISVFEGSCGNLRCVIANDQWCGYQSSVDWESVADTMYYILVHGSTGGTSPSMGDFGLAVYEFKASVNDLCTDAIMLQHGSVTAGSTTTASADDYVDSCDRTGVSSNQSPGVWYKVVGTGAGMRASTCGPETTFDTRLSIYIGEDCQQLKCLLSDDNGCGFQSSAYWHANEGETYYILVTGNLFSSFGDFLLRIEDYRTNTINDFCANAIAASTTTVNLGSTKNATFDGVETCVVTNTAPGIWYTVQGSGTGMVASTCHMLTDFDTRISVFRGSDCEQLECVAGNDDSHQSVECGSSAASRVSWLSNPEEEYKILVHGWGALVGTFGLTIEEVVPVVPNDFCITSTPVDVSIGNATTTLAATGVTVDATVDNVPTCGDVDANGQGVWYRSVGTGSRLAASTCNEVLDDRDSSHISPSTLTPGVVTDFDTQISVFRGGCRALECIGANNDRCGLQSSVNFYVDEGEEFFVLVHGAFDSMGSFGLVIEEIFPQVPNDFCDVAAPLAIAYGGATNYVIGSTAEASYDTVEECIVPNTSPGVWYRTTGTGKHITVTTCSDQTTFDTRLSIYTGSCQLPECVTGNDDTSRDRESCGLASTASFPTVQGQIYYIRVHGWGSLVGTFQLSITEFEEPPMP